MSCSGASSPTDDGPSAVRDGADAGRAAETEPPMNDGGAADAGRSTSDGSASLRIPWEVDAFPSVAEPSDNPSSPEKIKLGRTLFYDPILSADHAAACGTCHSEFWGMTDGLPRSIGQGAGHLAGPGRTGPNVLRRNAQTLWNVAYRSSFFWDGRAASLEDQVHFPLDAAQELDKSIGDVVTDLRAIPAYVRLFQDAFPKDPEPVTPVTLARSIAAFERTIISKGGLYNAYVAGDSNAMNASMIHGMQLFASEGCATCHTPPLFSSERFEDRGILPIPGVEDDGRYEITHDEADRNRFKVPTLRNLHDSGPFFHTGAIENLEDAVEHEVDFSVAHDGAPNVEASDVTDLTNFIVKGLFDSTLAPTRPATVPSGLEVPVDGFSIAR